MKKILLQVVLIIAAVVLTYEIYDTVRRPIDFQKEKKVRYDAVVNKLKDIRKAELAYKDVNGKFTGSWDTLLTFVKTDSLPLVRKIGSVTDSMIDAGWTEEKALREGKIIRDTIKVAVLDSVFGKNYPINKLPIIPYSGGKKFFLGAARVKTGSGVDVAVFEARAHNNIILSQLEDEYGQEIINLNEKSRVDGKYPGLKVGSLTEANNNAGNWE
ncbi:hypothetical protein [Prolixibacter sp. NT017]|uniref:hypothetical protein n=1 Tax=Prolixibacter sp. NT017 TaxID=2652390 RepID=UPI00127FC23E|nr:hypothetical protein [Prolixibacter sp. NT017]GET23796.1 hypothetical protein NT017_01250 [Prolixibacter sp. NT017]